MGLYKPIIHNILKIIQQVYSIMAHAIRSSGSEEYRGGGQLDVYIYSDALIYIYMDISIGVMYCIRYTVIYIAVILDHGLRNQVLRVCGIQGGGAI